MHSPELDQLDPGQKKQEQDLLLTINTLDPQSRGFLSSVHELLINTKRFDPDTLEELFDTLTHPDLLDESAVEKVLSSNLNNDTVLAAALAPKMLAARKLPEAIRKAS